MPRYHIVMDVWVDAISEQDANEIIGEYRVGGQQAVNKEYADQGVNLQDEAEPPVQWEDTE